MELSDPPSTSLARSSHLRPKDQSLSGSGRRSPCRALQRPAGRPDLRPLGRRVVAVGARHPGGAVPLRYATGAHCAQRQVDAGPVPGRLGPRRVLSFAAAHPREFLPHQYHLRGVLLLLDTRTESFVRAAGELHGTGSDSVSLDGYTVAKPTRYFTGASGSQLPIFNVQLPPGNVFGLDETTAPELVLSPSAEQGYYLFVRPLLLVLTPSGGPRRGAPLETPRTSRTISPWSRTTRANRRAGPWWHDVHHGPSRLLPAPRARLSARAPAGG